MVTATLKKKFLEVQNSVKDSNMLRLQT